MPRVKRGAASRQGKKRLLKSVKGHRGPQSKQIRLAREAAVRKEVNARIGRKQKKRQFRGLWIIRLSAACKERGMNYSKFINGCKKAKIELNRKMLSEIAIHDPSGFDAIVERASKAAG